MAGLTQLVNNWRRWLGPTPDQGLCVDAESGWVARPKTEPMSVVIVAISASYPRIFLSIVDSPACPAV